MEKRQHHIAGDRRAKNNTSQKTSAAFARVIKHTLSYIIRQDISRSISLLMIKPYIPINSIVKKLGVAV